MDTANISRDEHNYDDDDESREGERHSRYGSAPKNVVDFKWRGHPHQGKSEFGLHDPGFL